MKAAIAVMTRNPGERIRYVLEQINGQGQVFQYKLVVDSNSEDNTCAYAEKYGFSVLPLGNRKFNHGGTRGWCVSQLPDVDIVVFMTQDALLASSDSVQNLLKVFSNSKVGAAYGRQLPHRNASRLAAHARRFNYGTESRIKSYDDRKELGIRTPFMSDSFAAYRVQALDAVGGFPEHVIIGEDMYVGAKLLQAGYSIAYAADAEVYHSHDYTLRQEFQRYFDTGVFQKDEPWIRESFGGAEGTGAKLVRSQLQYLWNESAYGEIFHSIVSNAMKFLGYRMGLYYRLLPQSFCKKLSGQRYYFD